MNQPFSNTDEKIFWIEEITRKFQEGTASDEEIANFRELLLEDAEARRIYHESNQLTLLLESVEATPASPKTIPFKSLPAGPPGLPPLWQLAYGSSYKTPRAPAIHHPNPLGSPLFPAPTKPFGAIPSAPGRSSRRNSSPSSPE